MLFSNRMFVVFLVFSLLTACAGQVMLLTAAPHPHSLRSISHRVERRIARGIQRRLHHPSLQRRISTQAESGVTVCVTVCVTGKVCPAP